MCRIVCNSRAYSDGEKVCRLSHNSKTYRKEEAFRLSFNTRTYGDQVNEWQKECIRDGEKEV